MIGIVGLGQIGGALVERLLATGEAPVVFDVRAEALAAAVAVGATPASSLADVGRACDVVLVAVRDDEQCLDAVAGLLEGMAGDEIIAVLATITPATVVALVALASVHGVELVDAPVAGQGRISIEAGTMSVLVGGEDRVVESLRPTFARFSDHVVATGPVGSGAALKLAHNVMVYLGYASVVEAIEVAAAAGVRPGLVEEVTRRSGTLSAQSEIFLEIYERRRQGEGSPEEDEVMRISATLLDKDLHHAVAVARDAGHDLPLAALIEGTGEAVYLVHR